MDARSQQEPPDLKTLLAASKRSGRGRKLPRDVAAARVKEQKARTATAQGLAKTALTRAFPNEYRALYEQAVQLVNEQRGPLPGDDK